MAVKLTCSRVDLADLLDLSQQRVGTLTKTGVLARTKAGYDVALSVKAYLRFLRSKPGSLTDQRSRLARLQADLMQLKVRQRTGELLERTAADNEGFRCARQARDNLQNVGARTGGLLAAETSPAACAAIVDQEVHACLENLVGNAVGE